MDDNFTIDDDYVIINMKCIKCEKEYTLLKVKKKNGEVSKCGMVRKLCDECHKIHRDGYLNKYNIEHKDRIKKKHIEYLKRREIEKNNPSLVKEEKEKSVILVEQKNILNIEERIKDCYDFLKLKESKRKIEDEEKHLLSSITNGREYVLLNTKSKLNYIN